MKGFLGLLKIAINRGRITLRYPKKEPPIPEGLRGKPEIDFEACIGCGGCVSVCPSNALTLKDNNDVRVISLFYGRCIFCGRCEESCPVGAIMLTNFFELASLDRENLEVTAEYKLAKCRSCGRYYTTEKSVKDVLSSYNEALTDYDEDLRKTVLVCTECKRKEWSESLAQMRREGMSYE